MPFRFLTRATLLALTTLWAFGPGAPASSQLLDTAEPEAAPLDFDPRQAVVRIYSTIRYPQLYEPWNKTSPSESTGTGFFINTPDGQRLILTNNHVVGWASQIYIEGYQSTERHRARVVAAATDFDLALLKLDKPEALADRPTLDFTNELPRSRDNVAVYGYPTGGNEQSVTKGIVSRVEVASYDESAIGLRVQVDAAINPGNSGGPAILDGRVVGVAFQANTDAENVGYLIPAVEVQRFLEDAADGSYEGKRYITLDFQVLDNPGLRDQLGLTSDQTGVMVNRVETGHPGLPTGSQFRFRDVVTHIGPYAIDNRGQSEIAPELRGAFLYLADPLVDDHGTVPLTVIRDGQTIEIREPAFNDPPLLLPHIGNGYPRYYIFGPMAFTQATRDFYEYVNRDYVPVLGLFRSPLVTRFIDRQVFPGEELVCVTAPFFPHPLVRGYDNPLFNVVEAVNGEPVKNLEHLVRLLNESEDEFLEFTFGEFSAEQFVFNRQDMKDSTEEILNDNGIRYQSSKDLRDLVESYEE
ncbi:MAG: trypsin-like peptidase domain-containing protein [Planctomycetota bacterium]